jgi:hypothetical protein
MQTLCECGCGQPAPIAPRTQKSKGWVKGQPLRFVRFHETRAREVRRTGPYKTERYRVEDRGYTTPCHTWLLGKMGKGYGCEWDPGRQRMAQAHIRAWESTHGPVPSGLELDHLCGNRDCVNEAHLEPVTHAENVQRGARTKLKPALIPEICEALRSGLTQREVADRYGVGQTAISKAAPGVSQAYRAERDDRIRTLAGAGWSQPRIAAEVGLSTSSVQRILCRDVGFDGVSVSGPRA